MGPLYDALNQPAKKDVARLLAEATHPDFRSYHTNEEWRTRGQVIEGFNRIGSIVPDLSWTIKDIQTFGNQILLRGESAGTPTAEFFAVKPAGKSFKTMSIDLYTVKDGKLAFSYHVENWMAVLQQIAK